MIKSLSIILLVLVSNLAQSQDQTLNIGQVLELVRQYHPIIRQANINVEKSEADIIGSKAAFDPILSNYSSKKTFDSKNYYTYNSPEIKIPTWYGIEMVAGTENLGGGRFDPSETVGKTSYVGIAVPLLKNLVMDKRRAYLKQAKILNNMAEVDKRAVVNDLMMDAAESYLTWAQAYQSYLIVKNNVDINVKRLEFIKKSLTNGERAAIDTLESATQLQSFQYLQNQKYLEFQNAGLMLSSFLWTVNKQPYILPETVSPQTDGENEKYVQSFNLDLSDLIQSVDNQHPYLLNYKNKLQTLAIDKSLKFQDLLPKLDFRYNQLGKGYKLLETATTGPLFQNNFQYGLKLEMPLRFSQGRADYKVAKLKIEETTLDQNQKLLALQIKIKQYFNEYEMLKQQIALQSRNFGYYQQLVKAEETKLTNGESSLFLVNSREIKALEVQEKLVELKTKYFKTLFKLQWAAGLLL